MNLWKMFNQVKKYIASFPFCLPLHHVRLMFIRIVGNKTMGWTLIA